MSRTTKGARARSQRSGRRARPPARGPGRSMLLAMGALALAGIAVVAVTMSRRPRPDTTGSPLDRMAPAIAYSIAADSARAGRMAASLPFYRRASAAFSPEIARVHLEFARALLSSGYETRADRTPVLRSSVERVQMMREAIGQMEIVNRLSASPAARAGAMRECGEMMFLWGFPWETFLLYRKAEEAEPGNLAHATQAQAIMTLMQYPNRFALDAVPVRMP